MGLSLSLELIPWSPNPGSCPGVDPFLSLQWIYAGDADLKATQRAKVEAFRRDHVRRLQEDRYPLPMVLDDTVGRGSGDPKQPSLVRLALQQPETNQNLLPPRHTQWDTTGTLGFLCLGGWNDARCGWPPVAPSSLVTSSLSTTNGAKGSRSGTRRRPAGVVPCNAEHTLVNNRDAQLDGSFVFISTRPASHLKFQGM